MSDRPHLMVILAYLAMWPMSVADPDWIDEFLSLLSDETDS